MDDDTPSTSPSPSPSLSAFQTWLAHPFVTERLPYTLRLTDDQPVYKVSWTKATQCLWSLVRLGDVTPSTPNIACVWGEACVMPLLLLKLNHAIVEDYMAAAEDDPARSAYCPVGSNLRASLDGTYRGPGACFACTVYHVNFWVGLWLQRWQGGAQLPPLLPKISPFVMDDDKYDQRLVGTYLDLALVYPLIDGLFPRFLLNDLVETQEFDSERMGSRRVYESLLFRQLTVSTSQLCENRIWPAPPAVVRTPYHTAPPWRPTSPLVLADLIETYTSVLEQEFRVVCVTFRTPRAQKKCQKYIGTPGTAILVCDTFDVQRTDHSDSEMLARCLASTPRTLEIIASYQSLPMTTDRELPAWIHPWKYIPAIADDAHRVEVLFWEVGDVTWVLPCSDDSIPPVVNGLSQWSQVSPWLASAQFAQCILPGYPSASIDAIVTLTVKNYKSDGNAEGEGSTITGTALSSTLSSTREAVKAKVTSPDATWRDRVALWVGARLRYALVHIRYYHCLMVKAKAKEKTRPTASDPASASTSTPPRPSGSSRPPSAKSQASARRYVLAQEAWAWYIRCHKYWLHQLRVPKSLLLTALQELDAHTCEDGLSNYFIPWSVYVLPVLDHLWQRAWAEIQGDVCTLLRPYAWILHWEEQALLSTEDTQWRITTTVPTPSPPASVASGSKRAKVSGTPTSGTTLTHYEIQANSTCTASLKRHVDLRRVLHYQSEYTRPGVATLATQAMVLYTQRVLGGTDPIFTWLMPFPVSLTCAFLTSFRLAPLPIQLLQYDQCHPALWVTAQLRGGDTTTFPMYSTYADARTCNTGQDRTLLWLSLAHPQFLKAGQTFFNDITPDDWQGVIQPGFHAALAGAIPFSQLLVSTWDLPWWSTAIWDRVWSELFEHLWPTSPATGCMTDAWPPNTQDSPLSPGLENHPLSYHWWIWGWLRWTFGILMFHACKVAPSELASHLGSLSQEEAVQWLYFAKRHEAWVQPIMSALACSDHHPTWTEAELTLPTVRPGSETHHRIRTWIGALVHHWSRDTTLMEVALMWPGVENRVSEWEGWTPTDPLDPPDSKQKRLARLTKWPWDQVISSAFQLDVFTQLQVLQSEHTQMLVETKIGPHDVRDTLGYLIRPPSGERVPVASSSNRPHVQRWTLDNGYFVNNGINKLLYMSTYVKPPKFADTMDQDKITVLTRGHQRIRNLAITQRTTPSVTRSLTGGVTRSSDVLGGMPLDAMYMNDSDRSDEDEEEEEEEEVDVDLSGGDGGGQDTTTYRYPGSDDDTGDDTGDDNDDDTGDEGDHRREQDPESQEQDPEALVNPATVATSVREAQYRDSQAHIHAMAMVHAMAEGKDTKGLHPLGTAANLEGGSSASNKGLADNSSSSNSRTDPPPADWRWGQEALAMSGKTKPAYSAQGVWLLLHQRLVLTWVAMERALRNGKINYFTNTTGNREKGPKLKGGRLCKLSRHLLAEFRSVWFARAEWIKHPDIIQWLAQAILFGQYGSQWMTLTPESDCLMAQMRRGETPLDEPISAPAGGSTVIDTDADGDDRPRRSSRSSTRLRAQMDVEKSARRPPVAIPCTIDPARNVSIAEHSIPMPSEAGYIASPAHTLLCAHWAASQRPPTHVEDWENVIMHYIHEDPDLLSTWVIAFMAEQGTYQLAWWNALHIQSPWFIHVCRLCTYLTHRTRPWLATSQTWLGLHRRPFQVPDTTKPPSHKRTMSPAHIVFMESLEDWIESPDFLDHPAVFPSPNPYTFFTGGVPVHPPSPTESEPEPEPSTDQAPSNSDTESRGSDASGAEVPKPSPSPPYRPCDAPALRLNSVPLNAASLVHPDLTWTGPGPLPPHAGVGIEHLLVWTSAVYMSVRRLEETYLSEKDDLLEGVAWTPSSVDEADETPEYQEARAFRDRTWIYRGFKKNYPVQKVATRLKAMSQTSASIYTMSCDKVTDTHDVYNLASFMGTSAHHELSTFAYRFVHMAACRAPKAAYSTNDLYANLVAPASATADPIMGPLDLGMRLRVLVNTLKSSSDSTVAEDARKWIPSGQFSRIPDAIEGLAIMLDAIDTGLVDWLAHPYSAYHLGCSDATVRLPWVTVLTAQYYRGHTLLIKTPEWIDVYRTVKNHSSGKPVERGYNPETALEEECLLRWLYDVDQGQAMSQVPVPDHVREMMTPEYHDDNPPRNSRTATRPGLPLTKVEQLEVAAFMKKKMGALFKPTSHRWAVGELGERCNVSHQKLFRYRLFRVVERAFYSPRVAHQLQMGVWLLKCILQHHGPFISSSRRTQWPPPPPTPLPRTIPIAYSSARRVLNAPFTPPCTTAFSRMDARFHRPYSARRATCWNATNARRITQGTQRSARQTALLRSPPCSRSIPCLGQPDYAHQHAATCSHDCDGESALQVHPHTNQIVSSRSFLEEPTEVLHMRSCDILSVHNYMIVTPGGRRYAAAHTLASPIGFTSCATLSVPTFLVAGLAPRPESTSVSCLQLTTDGFQPWFRQCLTDWHRTHRESTRSASVTTTADSDTPMQDADVNITVTRVAVPLSTGLESCDMNCIDDDVSPAPVRRRQTTLGDYVPIQKRTTGTYPYDNQTIKATWKYHTAEWTAMKDRKEWVAIQWVTAQPLLEGVQLGLVAHPEPWSTSTVAGQPPRAPKSDAARKAVYRWESVSPFLKYIHPAHSQSLSLVNPVTELQPLVAFAVTGCCRTLVPVSLDTWAYINGSRGVCPFCRMTRFNYQTQVPSDVDLTSAQYGTVVMTLGADATWDRQAAVQYLERFCILCGTWAHDVDRYEPARPAHMADKTASPWELMRFKWPGWTESVDGWVCCFRKVRTATRPAGFTSSIAATTPSDGINAAPVAPWQNAMELHPSSIQDRLASGRARVALAVHNRALSMESQAGEAVQENVARTTSDLRHNFDATATAKRRVSLRTTFKNLRTPVRPKMYKPPCHGGHSM